MHRPIKGNIDSFNGGKYTCFFIEDKNIIFPSLMRMVFKLMFRDTSDKGEEKDK